MTIKQLLAMSDDELALELAKMLIPREQWKHDIFNTYGHCSMSRFVCEKCKNVVEAPIGRYISGVPGRTVYESDEPCSVPDPIKLDSNAAMEWFRKSHKSFGHLREIYFIVCQETINRPTFPWWLLYETKLKHYLIAAAIAKEAEMETTMTGDE